ncbi:Aste57867_23459 [Aphanomyces stellatus]|uniref:Aste57867_23459 protein n=1 Tax=Aphanomyces stellatus TaxID=120398 RepID=A0A485LPE6_9STRA|nr:hypothetical protein As57867_023388 [Aphanomyces stellatus]VFU00104.1 Aste57867_23459 [Aphanomyces stellatus]
MLPFTVVAVHFVHDRKSPVLQGQRESRFTAVFKSIQVAMHTAIHTWLQEWKYDRLPRVFACLPRLGPAFVHFAIWCHDMSLLEVLHGILNLTTICDLLLDWAASRNHLDIIIYLHGLGHIGCTKDGMDWACEHGNIEMVMFLHAHGYNTCTSDGLDKALAFGYMDIVAYVRENNLAQHGEGFLDLIDIVAGNGLMAAVEYLEGLGALVSPKAMDVAAAKGNMATVQWLHATYDAGCTYYVLQDASMNGHIDIVKFVIDSSLYGHGCFQCCEEWTHGNDGVANRQGCLGRVRDIIAGRVCMCFGQHQEGCSVCVTRRERLSDDNAVDCRQTNARH